MAKGGAVDLTRVQRAWLGHLRKVARGGETVRGYAARRGLSEHAMYQAAKVLRAKGMLGATAGRERTPAAAGHRAVRPRFVELKVAEERSVDRAGTWRARLPNGVVIEGEGELAGALEALGR